MKGIDNSGNNKKYISTSSSLPVAKARSPVHVETSRMQKTESNLLTTMSSQCSKSDSRNSAQHKKRARKRIRRNL